MSSCGFHTSLFRIGGKMTSIDYKDVNILKRKWDVIFRGITKVVREQEPDGVTEEWLKLNYLSGADDALWCLTQMERLFEEIKDEATTTR